MNKIRIFYTAVADNEGKQITIGGIQNYLLSLSEVLISNNYSVYIYQTAIENFEFEYKGAKIFGIKTDQKKSLKKQIKDVFNSTRNSFNHQDIIIWGTDKIALKTNYNKTIAIQHGVSFDYIPYNDLKFGFIFKKPLFGFIYKLLQTGKAAKEFMICKTVVCVDYNYLNWIRTYLPRNFSKNAIVIPNFSKTTLKDNIIHKENKNIKVLFARRFEAMRGVDIMIEIVKEISKKYSNVEFTICGDGSLKNKILNEIGHYKNVTMTKFNIDQSEEFNLNHHISIIPTYGSEGTSLSLLEAMAAGAVPIASNVGGITNIVINKFNGFLLSPKSEFFISTIYDIIEQPQILKELSINAKKTVNEGFSFILWRKSWLQVVNTINDN